MAGRFWVFGRYMYVWSWNTICSAFICLLLSPVGYVMASRRLRLCGKAVRTHYQPVAQTQVSGNDSRDEASSAIYITKHIRPDLLTCGHWC